MALNSNAFQVNEISIVPIDGDESSRIDLSSSVLFIEYFENIFSPNIIVDVLLTSVTSLVNRIPIRGGEKVNLDVSFSRGSLVYKDDNSLYAFEVGKRTASDTSELFVLRLISREAITNEIYRCMKRYDGRIDETVKKIIKDELKTDKKIIVDPTANSYSFVGAMKRPFNILQWLCTKSLPDTNAVKTKEVNKTGVAKGVAGFLFYENSEGFNFRSIESLVGNTNIGTNDAKAYPTYYATGISEENNPANEFKIQNYAFDRNINLINTLRRGTYANVTYFYNFHTQKFSLYEYYLKDEIKDAKKLGTNDLIPLSKSLGSSISRIMFRTSDVGVMDNGTDSYDEGSQRDISDIAKATSRYNILLSQTLNIKVPCNTALKVGDIIQVFFPKMGESNDSKKIDEEQSGFYLIYTLAHHVEPNILVTSLGLIRDSYGLYGAKNLK